MLNRISSRSDPGNYAHDWHLHRGEEVFLGWLEKAGAREVQTPALGDVAVFRYGRAYSHGAVVVPGPSGVAAVHAYLGRGVVQSRLDEEPLQGRAARFWSIGAARSCPVQLGCYADLSVKMRG